MEVLVNVTLSPCEGIGTLLKTLKHCFGMQAVSPEAWLISPLNAIGEQDAVANTITVTFNMKISVLLSCFIVYRFLVMFLVGGG